MLSGGTSQLELFDDSSAQSLENQAQWAEEAVPRIPDTDWAQGGEKLVNGSQRPESITDDLHDNESVMAWGIDDGLHEPPIVYGARGQQVRFRTLPTSWM